MPHPAFKTELCKGCGLCTSVCPKSIVKMTKEFNEKGYRMATCIDTSKCIGCLLCAKTCPDCVIEIYQ